MNNIKSYIIGSFMAVGLMAGSACKKQLDVKNPNEPTLDAATTEPGIIALAQGAVYQNGFNGIQDPKYTGFLGDSYFSLAPAYHELMGDVIAASAANAIINQIGVPDEVTFDDLSKVTNTAPSKTVLRINNSRSKAGQNPFYYEWTWMYFMNRACNNVLVNVENVKFSGDAVSKKNAVKAWAYWWKGFAYSHIGSIYYAGLIDDDPLKISNKYVNSAAIIAEANANFDKAITALNAVTTTADYEAVLGKIIPSFCQTGNGGILTKDMWIHNINTMKARNLLVNKTTATMTGADWDNILTLANNGIQSTDLVFTGRAPTANGFFSASSGTVAATVAGVSNTYWVTERFVQDFKPGDERFDNNLKLRTNPISDQGGTIVYGTRYQLIDTGAGMTGVATIATTGADLYELFIAGSYEENELMKAEAEINKNNIDAGLTSVDVVRAYQGAGLAATTGTGLSLAQAKEELRSERRVALALRGLSFYDARRWDVITNGRTGCVVLQNQSGTDVLNTNATIKYGFLDYWDVPDDELVLNPAAAGSAPTKNPK
jgi:starch-binding outer membrane protein, SusD/RagB family